jgi:hypothetical protein
LFPSISLIWPARHSRNRVPLGFKSCRATGAFNRRIKPRPLEAGIPHPRFSFSLSFSGFACVVDGQFTCFYSPDQVSFDFPSFFRLHGLSPQAISTFTLFKKHSFQILKFKPHCITRCLALLRNSGLWPLLCSWFHLNLLSAESVGWSVTAEPCSFTLAGLVKSTQLSSTRSGQLAQAKSVVSWEAKLSPLSLLLNQNARSRTWPMRLSVRSSPDLRYISLTSLTDAAAQFDDATKENMINLAIEYRQVEKNTPPVRIRIFSEVLFVDVCVGFHYEPA